jgi:hypothetical protein
VLLGVDSRVSNAERVSFKAAIDFSSSSFEFGFESTSFTIALDCAWLDWLLKLLLKDEFDLDRTRNLFRFSSLTGVRGESSIIGDGGGCGAVVAVEIRVLGGGDKLIILKYFFSLLDSKQIRLI